MKLPSKNPVASVRVSVTSAAVNVAPSLIVDVVAESMNDLAYCPPGIGLAVVPYTPRVTVRVLLFTSIPPVSIVITSVPVAVASSESINLVPSAKPVLRETLTDVAPCATSAMFAYINPVVDSNCFNVAVNVETAPVIVSPFWNVPIKV